MPSRLNRLAESSQLQPGIRGYEVVLPRRLTSEFVAEAKQAQQVLIKVVYPGPRIDLGRRPGPKIERTMKFMLLGLAESLERLGRC